MKINQCINGLGKEVSNLMSICKDISSSRTGILGHSLQYVGNVEKRGDIDFHLCSNKASIHKLESYLQGDLQFESCPRDLV